MHKVENVFMLNCYLQTQLFAFLSEHISKGAKFHSAVAGVNHHNHCEEFLQDCLADVQYINVGLSQNIGYGGNNANPIQPQHGNDYSLALFHQFAS